jgi:hypothetical protein
MESLPYLIAGSEGPHTSSHIYGASTSMEQIEDTFADGVAARCSLKLYVPSLHRAVAPMGTGSVLECAGECVRGGRARRMLASQRRSGLAQPQAVTRLSSVHRMMNDGYAAGRVSECCQRRVPLPEDREAIPKGRLT